MNSETFTFNLFMVNTISVNNRMIYIAIINLGNYYLYNIINMDSMHGQYAFIMTQDDRY